MPDKQSYWDGYYRGNRTYDGSPYDYGAAHKQRELEEQQRKEQEKRNEESNKFWNELGKSSYNYNSDSADSSYSGTSGGSGSLSGFLIIGIIAVCAWYFLKNTGSSSYGPPVYTENKLDEISNAPAAPGTVNIAEHILIYPNNKKSAIGQFKYGISEDSIKWFLAKANIDKAPVKTSWASKRMVYLKNIPRHWVTMTNGKKPVCEAKGGLCAGSASRVVA